MGTLGALEAVIKHCVNEVVLFMICAAVGNYLQKALLYITHEGVAQSGSTNIRDIHAMNTRETGSSDYK